MIIFNKFKDKNLNYYLIFLLTIIILVTGVVRDIDLNGDNSDDKLTFYVYAVSQNLDETKKKLIISDIKNAASKKCSSNKCINRLEMQLNQNNNYPIISFLVNYFDKLLQNDEGDLIKISKSVHWSLLTSQILFFIIFLIFAFKANKNIQLALIIILTFIVVIDKKIFNVNLLGFFPYWNSITSSVTEYVPRAVALFCGILSLVLFYLNKIKESIFFIIISFLYHVTFGLVLSILIFSYFIFDLTIKNFRFSKKKIIKLFFLILTIFSLLLNKSAFFLLIIPCFILCKNTKNFRSNNLIISLLLSILILMFIFTFENLLSKIMFMEQHYVYLINILNFLNFEFFINLFSYENLENFNNSYFMYYLRHAPNRFYPLIIPSLVIILFIENLSYINKKFSYYKNKIIPKIKSFKFIIVIIFFFFSPIVLERLFYVAYVYKNIQNDLVIGMKKEGTYLLLNKTDNFTYDREYLNLIDFKNREIFSFYLVSQIYKNNQ